MNERPDGWVYAQYGQLTEAEAIGDAQSDGFARVRITRRDAKVFVVTRDYRTDRINFEIEKNRVVKAFIG